MDRGYAQIYTCTCIVILLFYHGLSITKAIVKVSKQSLSKLVEYNYNAHKINRLSEHVEGNCGLQTI